MRISRTRGSNGNEVNGFAWQEWFACMAGIVCLHGRKGLLAWREWFAYTVGIICLHGGNYLLTWRELFAYMAGMV
jgi:hypothetical protein